MITQLQLQKQGHKLLPQQIQMLGIYHLNIMELEQRIKDELEDNPLLENAATDDLTEGLQPGPDDPPQEYQNWEEYGYDDIPNYAYENQVSIHTNATNLPIKDHQDTRSNLKQQLINFDMDEREKEIANFILDCISDNGYLEQSIAEIADDFSFIHNTFVAEETFKRILKKIHRMEPVGIGSQSIREFLILQLQQQKHCPIVRKAIELLTGHYPDLQKKQFDKICRALQIDEEELSILLKHIGTLQMNPMDMALESKQVKDSIIPDFILTAEGDTLMVDLYKQRSYGLHINEAYARTLNEKETKTAADKQGVQYLKSKLSSAQWFIDALKQREGNMLMIMRCILRKQRDYFLTGDMALLKPMILKDIAAQVGLEISAISRVTCNKYIETPFGLILLKALFSEAIVNEDGEGVSNKVVQIKLKEIIDAENRDKPYSDQQLTKLLYERGIPIARRTIAKYRELLHIPVGNMRRIWAKG